MRVVFCQEFQDTQGKSKTHKRLNKFFLYTEKRWVFITVVYITVVLEQSWSGDLVLQGML